MSSLRMHARFLSSRPERKESCWSNAAQSNAFTARPHSRDPRHVAPRDVRRTEPGASAHPLEDLDVHDRNGPTLRPRRGWGQGAGAHLVPVLNRNVLLNCSVEMSSLYG